MRVASLKARVSKSGRTQRSALRLPPLDCLFVAGIILAPYTQLRIYKFGPGELLLIVWMVYVYRRRGRSVLTNLTGSGNPICSYQLANLFMMMVGLFIGILFYEEFGTVSGVFTDLFSHIYMLLLTATMVAEFSDRKLEELNRIIAAIVVYGALVHGSLLLYAKFVGNTLFGKVLWMGSQTRFTGFAINPHQIGMIGGPGVFLALYLMSLTDVLRVKIQYLACAAIWFWIAEATKSDTMQASFILCVGAFILLKSGKVGSYRERRILPALVVTLACLCLTLLYPRLWGILTDFVMDGGNGENRLELWSNALDRLLDRPLALLTGLGPGAHTDMYMRATGNEMETHSTYVQIAMNAGIYVLAYYVVTVFSIIWRPFSKNTYLVLAVLYFVLYGVGGNMNRRVLVWFTYVMCWLLFQRTEGAKVSNR